jgi:hypothetical protein
MLILLRFVFPGKGEKPNDINGCIVKSDRLLATPAYVGASYANGGGNENVFRVMGAVEF